MKNLKFIVTVFSLILSLGIYFYLANLKNEVIHSPRDTRDYRALKLPNGIEALLISDPKADQAAAALSVGIGQFSDPENRPGLAHYLEHMLFLGTEAYPEADDFSKFIAQAGGFSNAYTADEETNYHFAVQPVHLSEGLKRFSQFFIKPLFDETYAGRELHAVDSEHQKTYNPILGEFIRFLKKRRTPSTPFMASAQAA